MASDPDSLSRFPRNTRRAKQLPPLDDIRQHLYLDASSPSGLRKMQKGKRQRPGDVAGRSLPDGRWQVFVARRQLYAHRVVYALHHGRDPWPLEVDHIDNDHTNNSPLNLRACTRDQNARNVGPNRNTQSPYRGVSPSPHCTGWVAQIAVDKRSQVLGTFAQERDAAAAYNEAAIRLHGEFARLNVLDSPGDTVSAQEWREKSA